MIIEHREYPTNILDKTTIPGFEKLALYPDLERPQRILGLLQDLSEIFSLLINICDEETSTAFGGWISYRITDISYQRKNFDENTPPLYLDFSLNPFHGRECKYYGFSLLAAAPLENHETVVYFWPQTNMWLSIPAPQFSIFKRVYGTYLKVDGEFHYDNLLHLIMIVKDAGDSFSQVLETYLPHIDRWTILDTGSTDGTIETIKTVLAGKRGDLFQESFKDFATTRNRCIELAGKSSVFTVMLDDTYKMRGDWRGFLSKIRTDQEADSFTIYISDEESRYISNRIFKPYLGLKYMFKIHEVVRENYNLIIPLECMYIEDFSSPYMNNRTRQRNYKDEKVLLECIAEEPNEPRYIYYLAQTYRVLGEKEKAFKTYIQRIHFPVEGYFKEKVDACFEVIRYGLFDFSMSLDDVYYYVRIAEKLDPERPEPWYFLGLYHYFRGEFAEAFRLLKKVFQIGYPTNGQFNTRPLINYKFTPEFLAFLCYIEKDWVLGKKVVDYYFEYNSGTDIMIGWKGIFGGLLSLPVPMSVKYPEKPILCIVSDGNWVEWSGSSINKTGLGGSETFIVEMARNIQTHRVVVFCKTSTSEMIDGVIYRSILEWPQFIQEYIIQVCLINRYSEYGFVAIHSNIENIYMISHDIDFTHNMLPRHRKIRGIIGLSRSHENILREQYGTFGFDISHFGYGINPLFFAREKTIRSTPFKFIYSSGPNRGLVHLLQMWQKILQIIPRAELTICCDMNNEWVRSVYSKGLSEIETLLSQKGIIFLGWVDKETLRQCWMDADIWFYPCIFKETFCLTALEAAASKTLSITNDLGSLEEVVGDRGVIIPGDAATKEWQEIALLEIKDIINDQVRRRQLIERNYKWALGRTWSERALEFERKYLQNLSQLEYRNMYNWTNDLYPGSFAKIAQLMEKLPRGADLLELGTFAGTSMIGFMSLTKESNGYVIDSWSDYEEKDCIVYCERNRIFNSFIRNIQTSGLIGRVSYYKGSTIDGLLELVRARKSFDFIHIDASHKPEDCYMDGMLAWRVLKSGGIMLFDDYSFHGGESINVIDSIVRQTGAQVLWQEFDKLACVKK